MMSAKRLRFEALLETVAAPAALSPYLYPYPNLTPTLAPTPTPNPNPHQVPLLRSMEAYERTAVADAFEEQSYAAGEVILREAEQGDTFYLLVSGTAAATKAGGEGRRLLLEYKEGDYFGELALLNNRRVPVCMACARHVHGMCMACASHVHGSTIGMHAHSLLTPHPSPLTPHSSYTRHAITIRPRAASVECLTDCTCVHLARPIFERLLGPVIHILKRNAENYKSYEDCQ